MVEIELLLPFSQEDDYDDDYPPCGVCHCCRCTDPECERCFDVNRNRYYGARCERYVEFYLFGYSEF